MTGTGNQPESWSSRLTFLLASVGFAVGLGNIWRFPYVVGENGGSAFVLIYLLFAFTIGVPLVMAEWMIGRCGSGTNSAAGSFQAVAVDSGASGNWRCVGDIAVIAVFMLMLFYTTIVGWTMEYFVKAASGDFAGIDAAQSSSMFDQLLANPLRLGCWHTIVVAVTVWINSRGLRQGIEKAVNVLMPALFVAILVMVVYAMSVGDLGAAANFLLTPDFAAVTGETALLALGQAFFSIGIAMAVMITYGSYLQPETSIPHNAFIVVTADTVVALMAGFAIFPLVFAHQLAPDSGTGLVFQTLPIVFGKLPGGNLFPAIFFFLLIAAAVTSCIGNFAPVVAWTEEKSGLSHPHAAVLTGLVLWLLGLGTVFSFNLLADFHPLQFIATFKDMTIYHLLDYIMSNILLPVGALLTAIFVGWIAPKDRMAKALGLGNNAGYKIWRLLMRYVVPLAVAVVFISGLIG